MKHARLSLFLMSYVFCLISYVAFATNQQDIDSLLYYIGQKDYFDAQREERIAVLQRQLDTSTCKYNVYSQLFDECSSYHFDRALAYVNCMMEEAKRLGDPDKVAYAAIQKVFAYLSAGLFKEGCDLMQSIDTLKIKESTRVLYHITYARLYADLAGYNHVDETDRYWHLVNEQLHNALAILTPQDTALYWSSMASLDQHDGINDRAIRRYEMALTDTRIGEHEKAIYLSTMAFLYSLLNDPEAQQHYNILAAIADIRSSTKETTAMRRVAERLYEEGEITLATRFIKYAQDDATFYNARHRQVEISQILPIIEQDNFQRMHERNRRVNILIVLSTLLICICLCVMVLFYRRNKALHEARHTIQQMNESLLVANSLKEEYIGNFLCWQSAFIRDLENYQQRVQRAAEQRKYEDLLHVPRQVNALRKREDFYRQFDEMFLHIFPTFVDDFNALLREGEKIELKKGELLNTDLRIFALMRLGITHNEVIAEVLNYSVNTIYTYKTKIKNRSDLSSELFMQRIMAIQSYITE